MSKKLFDELRELAAETRNKKLAAVRSEYSEAIAEIAAMEAKLLPKSVATRPKSKREERLVDLVASVIPDDRIVTVDDIQGLITARDPERKPSIQTLRMTLHRLVKECTLKKVNNPQADRKVGYCLPGFDAEAVRPLADWAEQILRETGKPMQAVEIMVAMTEAGYVLECEPQKAVRNLERAMIGSGLAESDGRWSFRLGGED